MKKNSTVRWREKGKIMAKFFIKKQQLKELVEVIDLNVEIIQNAVDNLKQLKQLTDILNIKDIDKKGESE